MPYIPAELVNSTSRDLTAKVKQVQEILPQVTDDQACLALAGADDDVMRAVEALLGAADPEPPPRQPAYVDYAPEPEPVYEPPPVPEEAPVKKEATANEKELMKWRKKLREIEKVSEMVAKGQKVQPNQLPKLQKRDEVELAVIRYESICAEERMEARRQAIIDAQRAREEEERRQQEAAQQRRIDEQRRREEQRIEMERQEAARQEAARQEAARQEAARQEAARQRARPQAQYQQASAGRPAGRQDQAGAAILSMVQPAQKQVKDEWGSAQYWDEPEVPVKPTRTVLPPAANGRAKKERVDMTEYTTPLDETAIPQHVVEYAERIAAEIEGGQPGKPARKGGPPGAKGGKKGGDRRHDDSWDNQNQDGWSKGKGRKKGDAKGDGKRGGDYSARGPSYGAAAQQNDDGGFDEWLRQRRGGR